MDAEFAELQFCGKVESVAEDALKISLSEDNELDFARELYQEYQAAGKPKNVRQWIKDRLEKAFHSVGAFPKWLESECIWPFHKGKPMTYIGQLTVPQTEVSVEFLSPGCELFIFGARDAVDGKAGTWTMVYRVIQHHPDFAAEKSRE